MDEVEKLIPVLLQAVNFFCLGGDTERWGDQKVKMAIDAAVRLGEIGDARAVEPLIEALGSIHSDIQIQAADALGNIGDVRAVEPLIKVLQIRNDEKEKNFWTYSCPRYYEHDYYEGLLPAAVVALGKIGDTRTVNPLIELFSDEIAMEETANALSKIDPNWHKSEAAHKLIPAM